MLSCGYLPATRGNPRPFGMPTFAHVLNDADIAAVVSYVRGAWGNDAAPVTQLQVSRYRQ
jgi:mono/diheme cytochrome c family protein